MPNYGYSAKCGEKMAIKTAQMLLEDIKKQITVTAINTDILEKKYGKQPDEIKQIMQKYKAQFIREILVQPIFDAVSESELKIFKNIVIDAIPLNAINAHAIRAENGEYLVIINERLMALIHSWCEIQIIALDKLKGDADTEYFSQHFAPIVDCYLNPLSANTLPIFSTEELVAPLQILALIKTIMCEQFIIAHELSHVYLGHCETIGSKFSCAEFMTTYPAQNESQQREFDADIQAVKWLIALSKSDSLVNPLQKSPLLFLEIFAILNMLESNISFPQGNSSHPSAIARLINIRDYFGNEVFNLLDYSIDEMIENLKDTNSFIIKRNPFE